MKGSSSASSSSGNNKRRSISPPSTPTSSTMTKRSTTITKATTTPTPTTTTTAVAQTLSIASITNILARLPTKTVTRFESVSKQWYSHIHSPDFISAHLHRSSASTSLILLRCHNNTHFLISLIDPLSDPNCLFKVPFLSSLSCYPKIVGSCNGLLCLDISSCFASGFVLWNLGTRKYRDLPKPCVDDSRLRFWMVSAGFGYNRGVDDYKVVRIVNFACGEESESHLVRAEVYSLRSDSWRVIGFADTEQGKGGKLQYDATGC